MSIGASHFNAILAKHGETFTRITADTTYEEDHGSIESETKTETSVTIYAQPISESHPLVVQGKIKRGSRTVWAKPTDEIADGEILKDSSNTKWKVMSNKDYRDAITEVYDEFILVRNE